MDIDDDSLFEEAYNFARPSGEGFGNRLALAISRLETIHSTLALPSRIRADFARVKQKLLSYIAFQGSHGPRPVPIPDEDSEDEFDIDYPEMPPPVDPARILSARNLRWQRTLFISFVLALNLTALLSFFLVHDGLWVLVFILYVKSKDVLSTVLSATCTLIGAIYRYFVPPREVGTQWILSLIPTYSESEEQIVKCIFSLRDNQTEPHQQVMCVILDGKPRDVKGHMTTVLRSFKRPYITSKSKLGELAITGGWMNDVAVIVIEKLKNAGKKDSLILAHDLFNFMRPEAPLYTKLLRQEIWISILPPLTQGRDFNGFDMVFCTDADSTVHKGAVSSLANALARNDNAIAACGLVLVELEPGYEWSIWNLFQQYQYTYGQYVRRKAEGYIGKVTCLPGCITMIRVRKEMAGAIRKYAEPVRALPVVFHQVQYLGTDRRLTYSMLSQHKNLQTLFVPEALSETVAPQNLKHYLSQRQRWGSNAFFNNLYYCLGENMIVITRVAASIELVRLVMVYYRLTNTALLIYSLTKYFSFQKILPLLIVGQLATIWYFTNVLFLAPPLQERAHKLIVGAIVNKLISPVFSIIVFSRIALNVGSQVWGITGGTAPTAAPVPPPAMTGQGLQGNDNTGRTGESERKTV